MHKNHSLRDRGARVAALALSASLCAGALAPLSAVAVTRADLSDPALIVGQQGESGVCTLAAATTMLRRAALLNGDAGWASITKDSVRQVAWYPGLPWYFEYRGLEVSHDALPAGERVSVLKALLAEHPEGYVLYAGNSSWPHAVVVIDDLGDDLLVVEPFDGSVEPLSESTLVSAYNADSYWYVSSHVTPPSDAQTAVSPVAAPDAEPGSWLMDEGIWYFEREGELSRGWDRVDGRWYLFDDEGAMLTGWQQVDGVWYYLEESGAMHAGWLLQGDSWYLLDGSGALCTGWRLVGDTWYYLNGLGVMLTGPQQIGDASYLFGESGAMLVGWQLVDDAWHYYGESGAMLSDTWVDGYHLNVEGVLE